MPFKSCCRSVVHKQGGSQGAGKTDLCEAWRFRRGPPCFAQAPRPPRFLQGCLEAGLREACGFSWDRNGMSPPSPPPSLSAPRADPSLNFKTSSARPLHPLPPTLAVNAETPRASQNGRDTHARCASLLCVCLCVFVCVGVRACCFVKILMGKDRTGAVTPPQAPCL